MDEKEKTCKNCERFKLYETKPTERTDSIETVNRNMQRQLSQILIILSRIITKPPCGVFRPGV